MRIESTEKYPIYIVTEDSFGTAYCIKANKCSDILDDMHSNREQVPRDNAKVFFLRRMMESQLTQINTQTLSHVWNISLVL